MYKYLLLWCGLFVNLICITAAHKDEVIGNVCLVKDIPHSYEAFLADCDTDPIDDEVISNASCPVWIVDEDTYSYITCVNGQWELQHMYAGTSHHSIQKRGVSIILGLIIGLISTSLTGVASGTIASRVINSGQNGKQAAPQNEPPEFTYCPRVHYTQIAEKGQITKRVTWYGVEAIDAEGKAKVTLVRGRASGSTFQRGEHTIIYQAEDEQGLTDYCNIRFNVKVIKCTSARWPRHGIKTCDGPDGEEIYGASCTFDCHEGYEIEGSKTITCENDGEYTSPAPACNPIKCKDPIVPKHAQKVCRNPSHTLGSICTSECDRGFAVETFSTSRCQADKTWSSPLPECIDIDPPEFTNCPVYSEIKKYAERGLDSALVYWDDLLCKDNVDTSLKPKLYLGPPNGSRFEKGTTYVEYHLTDSAKNEANPCRFMVTVEEILCEFPRLTDKFIEWGCPDGFTFGRECKLSCSGNFPLIGNDILTCETKQTQPDKQAYAFWDWGDGNEPFCKTRTVPEEWPSSGDSETEDGKEKDEKEWDIESERRIEMLYQFGGPKTPFWKRLAKENPCANLYPPTNGAMACDRWLYGKMCTMQCNENWDIPFMVVSNGLFSGLFTCGSSGKWLPMSDVPDCSEKKNAFGMSLKSELYYYSGSCKDALQDIEEKFITIMNNDVFPGICPGNTCNLDNVDVTCGPVSSRRRRDITMLHAATIGKRSPEYQTAITFKIQIPWTPVSANVNEDANNPVTVLKQLSESISNAVKGGTFTLYGHETGNFYTENPEFECADGLLPGMTLGSCLACPKGWEYSRLNSTCTMCEIGTYRADDSTLLCQQCPIGQSTVGIGAKKLSQCTDICQPGQFSIDGLGPCLPCKRGFYQPSSRMVECFPCPDNMTTLNTASVSTDECKKFDLTFSQRKSKVLFADTSVDIHSFSFATWIKLTDASGDITFAESSHDNSNFRIRLNETGAFVHMSGTNIQFNLSINRRSWRHIAMTFDTTSAQFTIYSNGVKVASEDVPILSTFTISVGTPMELHSSQNAATTLSNILFVDICLPQDDILKLSQTCDGNIPNAVYTMADLLHAELQGADITIPRVCDAVDACLSSPCSIHECIDLDDGFKCQCSRGYSGTLCEKAPDYCANNECANGASCRNANDSYVCDCPLGYSGDLCSHKAVDGRWSGWSNWSPCSVSCGGSGHRFRTRRCDSPVPDDEGKYCEGESEEHRDCLTERCRVCPHIPLSPSTEFHCNDTRGMKSCTLRCKPGMAFVDGLTPQLSYRCGRYTDFHWLHTTHANPLGRLPGCTNITSPEELSLDYILSYLSNSVPCKNAEKNLKENVKKIDCVSKGTCKAKVSLSGCGNEGSENRQKRKREVDPVQAGITISVELNGGSDLHVAEFLKDGHESPEWRNLIMAYGTLEMAYQEIANRTVDVFNLNINGVKYKIDPSTFQVRSIVHCEPGHVSSEGTCGQCPEGTEYRDSGCIFCAKGTYQERTGQSFCMKCPVGMTTIGIGSTQISDCAGNDYAAGRYQEAVSFA